MEISIASAVWFILYILGAGMIFGLLLWMIGYVEASFPTIQPFGKFARIALVILAVLVLIGVILSFMGHPVFRLRP